MDLNKEVKSKRGQSIILGAIIGACLGFIWGNLLALAIIGGVLGYVWNVKHTKKSAK